MASVMNSFKLCRKVYYGRGLTTAPCSSFISSPFWKLGQNILSSSTKRQLTVFSDFLPSDSSNVFQEASSLFSFIFSVFKNSGHPFLALLEQV